MATHYGVTHLYNVHLCSVLVGHAQFDLPSYRLFTDDCFSNLWEFITGFIKCLLLKDSSVPSLFGSAEYQTVSIKNNRCFYFLLSSIVLWQWAYRLWQVLYVVEQSRLGHLTNQNRVGSRK